MKGKITNSIPTCQLCGEPDADKIHLYFTCEKNNGCGRNFMKIMRTYSQYDENDVLNMKILEENPKLSWFAANYLHFVTTKREHCTPEYLKQYLITEFEVFKMSRHCDESMEAELRTMINLTVPSDD